MNTVIVTGAAGNLGLRLVRRLLDHGCEVVITSRKQIHLDEVLYRFKANAPKIRGSVLTLNEERSIEDFISSLSSDTPFPDVLINNAAADSTQGVMNLTYSEMRDLLSTNFLGCAYLSSLIVREWIARGIPGKIVNVSSLLAELGAGNSAGYGASKAALESFGRHLAVEAGPYSIRCNSVQIGACPGRVVGIHEEGRVADTADDGTAACKNALSSIPLERLGMFDEYCRLITFLASDDSSFVTGQTYRIDGGLSATLAGYKM